MASQCDEQSPGRFNIGITAIIRITLRDGTFHEDTGYGGGENLKGKGSALDKVGRFRGSAQRCAGEDRGH